MVCFVILTSLVVLFGWVVYDFFSEEYMDLSDRNDVWFGLISGIAFCIIAVPWLASFFSIYGTLHVIIQCHACDIRQFKCLVFPVF